MIAGVDIISRRLQVDTGGVPSGSPSTSNPQLQGGIVETGLNTAEADGDLLAIVVDSLGKSIVLPYANPENFIDGVVDGQVFGAAGNVNIIAAQGVGTRLYLTSLWFEVTVAAITVKVNNGAGGAVRISIIPAVNTPVPPPPNPCPYRFPDNVAINISVSAACTLFANAAGYVGR